MKQKHHPKEEAATPTQAAIAPSATKLRTQKRNQKRKMNKMLKLNTTMSMTEPQSQTTPISTENQNHHSFSTLSQSIESIRKLSSLVSQFTSQWDNLNSHLSTILLSIDSLNSQQQQRLLPQNPSLENNPNSLPNFNSLCIRMDAAELRKSLLAHHEENETVIKRLLFFALRDAPDPIRLVLDFIYGNGVERVYPETFGASPVQKAVVTVLMVFLQLGPWGMEEHHVEDAERIVTLWMERIVAYGGIAEAATTDCLNLLLFLCSFGVPGDNVVNVEDLAALVRWSGAVKLRRILSRRTSSVFMERIPAIISWQCRNRKHIEAVDLVFAFGLEHKYKPISLLHEFLAVTSSDLRKLRDEANNTFEAQEDSFMKHLNAISEVMKCTNDHNLQADAEASGMCLEEKVVELENLLAEAQKSKGGCTSPTSAKSQGPLTSPPAQLRRLYADPQPVRTLRGYGHPPGRIEPFENRGYFQTGRPEFGNVGPMRHVGPGSYGPPPPDQDFFGRGLNIGAQRAQLQEVAPWFVGQSTSGLTRSFRASPAGYYGFSDFAPGVSPSARATLHPVPDPGSSHYATTAGNYGSHEIDMDTSD